MIIKNVKSGLNAYKSKDEIIAAWWDKKWFETMLSEDITDEEWGCIIDECEDVVIENSGLGDALMDAADGVLKDLRKPTME